MSSVEYSLRINKTLILFLIIFTLIITLQLIYVYIESGGYILKNLIKIPYGKSNSIASPLLFSYVFWLYYDKSNNIKVSSKIIIVNIILSLTGLILTQSLAALLLVLIFTLPKTKKLNFLGSIFTILILLSFLTIFISIIKDKTVILKNLNIGSLDQIEIIEKSQRLSSQGISHGRIYVYKQGIENFILHPYFGCGLGNLKDINNLFVGTNYFKTHNIFIDLLAINGIFGFIIYSFILFYTFLKLRSKRIKEKSTKNELYIFDALYYSFLAVIFHGMVEPNFMSFKFDIFIWPFISYSYVIVPLKKL